MTGLDGSTKATRDASRAGRAIGAMFFSVFGGGWIGLWAYQVFARPLAAEGIVALATLLFVGIVLGIHRRRSPASEARPDTPATHHRSRGFLIVNAGQWIALIVVANVLQHFGLAQWIIPAALFIVGAHFVPLARLFDYPPHLLTGVAMMLVAIAYPLVAPAGAASPVGCLAAGLILWSSAAWAVTRGSSPSAQ